MYDLFVFEGCHSDLQYYCPSGNPGGITFTPLLDVPTKSITVSAVNGTITPSTYSGIPGETISIDAAPSAGYRLQDGSLKYNDGTIDHSLNGADFTMPENDITISAIFEAMTISVDSQNGDLTAGTAGSATFAAITGNIADGTAVTVNWCNAGGSPAAAPTGLSASGTDVESNGSTVTVAASAAAQPGTYYFKVTGNGAASNVVTVTVKLPPLDNIAITTPATKLVYTVGDILDISGMVVTGTYSNGFTTAETTTTANVTGFDSSAPAASQTLTVTVAGKSTTYTVTINAPLPTYTVTFYSIDADTVAIPLTKAAISGGNVGTLPTAPSRAGYTFAGWNTAANGSGTVFTAATTVLSNITVYSRWTLIPPTDAQKVAADKAALGIGFMSGNSASSVTRNLILADKGDVYGSTITWSTDNTAVISNNGVVSRPAYESGDANVTLTATTLYNVASDTKAFHLIVLKLPQETFSVTFNKNGGDTEASPGSITVTSGGNVGTLPAEPARSGYTFSGWNTAANGSGTAFTTAAAVTSNITVYAQWTANNSGNGGGGGNKETPPVTPKLDTSGSTATATTETKATVEANGKAAASVTKDQLNSAVNSAVAEAKKQGNGTAAVVEIKVDAPRKFQLR